MTRENFQNRKTFKTIAVAAGKGGVGKSTVSVLLAYALVAKGYKVGLLDADIYGPSQGHMMNLQDNPELNDKGLMVPVERHGVKVISMAMLVPADAPIIWRGPMVQKAVDQLVYGVDWGGIDFLILDLPPGTGDIQLSLMQQAALGAALLVTTPQDIARIDVRRARGMFERLNVPILGVIENMSYFKCPQCKACTDIYPQGTVELSEKLLGRLPLLPVIAESADKAEMHTLGNCPEILLTFNGILDALTPELAGIL